MILVGLSVTTLSRAAVLTRVAAKGIDLLIFFFLAVLLPYPLGPLLGFVYSLSADSFSFGPFRGQSVGKKLMKLQVRSTKRGGETASFKESLLRNAPVGVVTFFGMIPIWGWFILFLIGLPLFLIEVYLMAKVGAGQRLGDVMGDTEVVEAKA